MTDDETGKKFNRKKYTENKNLHARIQVLESALREVDEMLDENFENGFRCACPANWCAHHEAVAAREKIKEVLSSGGT